MMTGLNMIEALKARASMAQNRKTLTPEEIRERFHNSEFFKKLKEAKEKAIANGTAKPMPKMDGRMAEVLKKMKEARTNKMNKEN
jgi:hypothetical protein